MKKLLVLALLCFVVVSGCKDCETPPDPTGNSPQPIDERLLGSGIRDGEFGSGYTIVTFSENNECFIEINGTPSAYFGGPELYGYVNGDILVIPDYFDSRTKRFPEYRYKLEDNELQLEGINHPFVGCGDFTMEGPHSPLLIDKEVFTKLEE